MTTAARLKPPNDWLDKGWTTIPGYLSEAELAELRSEADRLMTEKLLFETRGTVINSPSRTDRIDPVIDISPCFAALACCRRMLALVSDFLGGPAELLKDKFIAKPPGTAGYATHQDASYWMRMGIDPHRFLTAVLFLDEATAENGAIEAAAGFHGRLHTDPNEIDDPDEMQFGEFETMEANAGDLLLIHALTPHRSGHNRSDGMRRALLLSYGVDARGGLYQRYAQLRQEFAK